MPLFNEHWKADSNTQISLRNPANTTIRGNSGGLTVIGGTASGDDITFQSTSDTTKGNIFLDDAVLLWPSFPTSPTGSTTYNLVNFAQTRTVTNASVFIKAYASNPSFSISGNGAIGFIYRTLDEGGTYTSLSAPILSTFQLMNAAPILTSGTTSAPPMSPTVLQAAQNINATANNVGTVGASVAVGNAPTIQTTGAATQMTVTSLAGLSDAPMLKANTSGGQTTVTTRRAVHVNDITFTATGTVTVGTNIGLDIENQVVGTSGSRVVNNVYGIRSLLQSGTNRWFIYDVGGGASSTHRGNLLLGSSSSTATPTNLLSMDGQSAQTFWMERHTTANTAGNSLTVQGGGATSAATDKPGGSLILAPGMSTGRGTAVIIMQGLTTATGSLTTDNTAITREVISGFRSLTNNSTMAIAAFTIGSTTVIGGVLRYSVEALSQANQQVEVGQVVFVSRNSAGATVSSTPIKFGNQQTLSAGSLTVTFQLSSGNPAEVVVTASSSLALIPGFPRITFAVSNLTQQAMSTVTG